MNEDETERVSGKRLILMNRAVTMHMKTSILTDFSLHVTRTNFESHGEA